MNENKQAPCVRCGFEDSFIVDYDERGKEYTFCGNCRQIVGEFELELVSNETAIIRAALRLAQHNVDSDANAKRIYDYLDASIAPIGYLQFSADDAVRICMALSEFAEIAGRVGHGLIQHVARDLIFRFLQHCPVEEEGSPLPAPARIFPLAGQVAAAFH